MMKCFFLFTYCIINIHTIHSAHQPLIASHKEYTRCAINCCCVQPSLQCDEQSCCIERSKNCGEKYLKMCCSWMYADPDETPPTCESCCACSTCPCTCPLVSIPTILLGCIDCIDTLCKN